MPLPELILLRHDYRFSSAYSQVKGPLTSELHILFIYHYVSGSGYGSGFGSSGWGSGLRSSDSGSGFGPSCSCSGFSSSCSGSGLNGSGLGFGSYGSGLGYGSGNGVEL